MKTKLLALAAFAAILPISADAATYVGSWTVDQGPRWTEVPPAYSGQQAAALLFGGSPEDYVISTISEDEADINNLAWVSTWGGCGGFPCGTEVAEDFVVSSGGLYANPGDTSAYVNDWSIGRNIATTPSWRMLRSPSRQPGR